MFAASLPDLDSLDLEAAKALLLAQHKSYTATLSSRSTEIEHLVLLVEKLQRMLFGTKSEKVLRQIEQLELQLEELQADNAIEEQAAVASAARPMAAKPFRRPLPEHLPREIHTHMPDHEACPDCGGRLRVLGEDVAEMLEHVRACFKVIRHVRPKMSCDACDRIVQAPAPSRPIDRGLAGPGLLAHVLVSKYADHLPLYRQAEIYSREGLDLDRSTLAGWVGATSELLAPLVEAIRAHVMSASKLHADDTPVPVLAPGNGKTRIGRLWTYVRDDRPSGDTIAPAVWFAYSPDRKGENPRQHLKHYKGSLQADAFAGFQQLYEGGAINEVACWAHARRKFHEIHIAHASPTTAEAIERIAALYAIEAEIRGSTPEIRRSIRQARARPLLDSMRTWMEATLAKLSRKSDTAAAIRYASSRWQALTRYVDDGQLEIDNNAAERALRVVALGRKNSHDRQLCQAWHSELRHKCSFVTGKAREHTRRLLKLSFGRWITQGNDSSEGCLYLPAEIRMHDSKFLLKGSLTDRALVLCLVTSWWTSSSYAPMAGDSWLACARAMAHTKPSNSRATAVTAI